MLLGQEHCMTSNKEATIFSTWSTAVVVKGLSAFYSRWFCLCRDGVVCFFICVSLFFRRAVRTPSKEKVHYQSQQLAQVCFQILSVARANCQVQQVLYILSHGMFTCLDLKQYRHYSPHEQVILVFLLPPYHPFSVPIPHSLE